MIFCHIFQNGDRKTGTFFKIVVDFQAVSLRSRLGMCKLLHGVAENQAPNPDKWQEFSHLQEIGG